MITMFLDNECMLGFSELGASTFVASAHPSESCGSNGLPLTPNSVRILGLSHHLYNVHHPHLCCYVQVQRGKHERLMVIQEYYSLNIHDAWMKYDDFKTEKKLLELVHQVLQGLVYLNNLGVSSCCNISPQNILIDPFGRAKLYSYGLYYITEKGSAVSFPIGVGEYSAPEVLVSWSVPCSVGGPPEDKDDPVGGGESACSNSSVDVWSLACVLLQLLLTRHDSQHLEPPLSMSTVLQLVVEEQYSDLAAGLLAEMPHLLSAYQGLQSSTKDLLRVCLQLSPSNRPTPSELLQHPAFASLEVSTPLTHTPTRFPSITVWDPELHKLPPSDTILPDYPLPSDVSQQEGAITIGGLRERSIREVFHLWQLAGGQIEQELVKHGLIHSQPPILTLPSVAVVEGELIGGEFYRLQQQPRTLSLSLSALLNHLAHVPTAKYYPLITLGETGIEDVETRHLPLVIREKDVEYQFYRVVLYQRMLQAYPVQRQMILKEARQDIAPYRRGLVWAALLGVDGDTHEAYCVVDKVTPTSTDRQIEVDIPRCHQYDELLSSPQGHAKFTRLLKAWVVSHPGLVYWQGLDSLTAPFLYLNFNNESLAYACLCAFIDKYLHQFFLRDNSAIIQEYLAKFSQLIAFHDPELHTHLAAIGFVPELYAIPWFLTMYTHVFPLSQIFHVWDTLLLYPASLPLCVAAAILRHLRHQLLTYSFNDCILLFSDMPDINIEVIVKESVALHHQTPTSLTYRRHAPLSIERLTTARRHNANDQLQPEEALSDLSDITLVELRSEVCARISAADVLTAQKTQSAAPPIVIDVRHQHLYLCGSLPGAWNIPGDAWLSCGEDETRRPSIQDVKDRAKGAPMVVVMGTKQAWHVTIQVCEQLVLGGVSGVCALHGGVEVLHTTGHLLVASPSPS